MERSIKVKDELTLADLVGILWRKAFILALALVIGVIAGGIFGVFQTWNVHYYGTTVEFYINPIKESNASEDESVDAENKTDSQYSVYGSYGKLVMESMVELLNSESFSEVLLLDEDGMPAEDITNLPTEIKNLIKKVEKGEADANAVVAAWRKTKHYQKAISFVSAATSYSCVEEKSSSNNENLSKSFIVVNLSVLNGEDQAEFLLDRIKTRVPAYVKKNMFKPDGYDTSCQRITRLDDVKLLNPGSVQSTAIKYAILLGAATFLAACVAVIVVDYSDKRLRNFERTMEQLGVPVLGVIPTILEPQPKTQTDKEVAQ